MGNQQASKQQSYKRRTFTTVQDGEESEDDSLDQKRRFRHPSPNPQAQWHRTLKILILGDENTGKTSFWNRLTGESEFHSFYAATIGVSFGSSYLVVLDDKNIRVQTSDTPGHERYRELLKPYYRDAMGIFLLFDVTNKKSFQNIQMWLKIIQTSSLPNIPVMLIGNKCDLRTRCVKSTQAKALADDSKLPYVEVSCKDGTNVEFAHLSLLALVNRRTRDVHSADLILS